MGPETRVAAEGDRGCMGPETRVYQEQPTDNSSEKAVHIFAHSYGGEAPVCFFNKSISFVPLTAV